MQTFMQNAANGGCEPKFMQNAANGGCEPNVFLSQGAANDRKPNDVFSSVGR